MEFRPKERDDDFFIVVVNKNRHVDGKVKPKCSSKIGFYHHLAMNGQTVNLGVGCLKKQGRIQHEFIHAMGFWHEQARFVLSVCVFVCVFVCVCVCVCVCVWACLCLPFKC